MAQKQKQTFESAINELEACTEKLACKDTTLEESLVLYERCVKLAGFCQTALEQAQQKVEVLEQGNADKQSG